MRRIRWLQLMAFGVLFLVVGDSTGPALLVCSIGQVAAVILLMQIVRIIGRRIITRWIILEVLQGQQALLLVLLPFVGKVNSLAVVDPVQRTFLWMAGAAGVVSSVILATGLSFSVAYFLRLWSRDLVDRLDGLPSSASAVEHGSQPAYNCAGEKVAHAKEPRLIRSPFRFHLGRN